MAVSRLLRLLLSLIGVVLFTGLLLEGALRLANALGIATPEPRLTEPSSFYRDDDPAFGVWHPPNSRYRAHADCFDVIYESNEFGMRDPARSLRASGPRSVVLGDSFVEGIGVPLGARMTDLLEQRTGIEHLNFGTAGNFSSTQQALLYETLASRFDHDRVLIFTFPNNDFLENDPERFWERDRYRPYLRRKGDGGFEVFYPVALEDAKQRAVEQLGWNRWYNRIFVYRLVAFLDSNIRVRLAQGRTGPQGYIGYEQFTEEDLERLFYGYRRIRDLAAGREVVIFTVPRLNDLLVHSIEGYPDALPRRLQQFAAQEENIRYYDLIPGFARDLETRGGRFADYFLPCDGHWNELGNQVAADVVLEKLRSDEPGSEAQRPAEPGRKLSAAPERSPAGPAVP